MYNEIEVKILDINVEKIKTRLKELGAKDLGEQKIIDINYDHPNNSKKTLLRLRKSKENILTFKYRNKDEEFIDVNEYETKVEDFDMMRKIFEKAGIKEEKYREKIRHSFALDKVKVEIDKYPTIPAYLEIEGSKDNIRDIVKKLGYTMEDTSTLVATQILKKHGQDPSFQKFHFAK